MQNTQDITLNVAGMTCGSCVRHINVAVRELPGIIDVEVKLNAGTVRVDFDPLRAKPESIVAAIEGVGYEVTRGG
jgi:copper chaperone